MVVLVSLINLSHCDVSYLLQFLWNVSVIELHNVWSMNTTLKFSFHTRWVIQLSSTYWSPILLYFMIISAHFWCLLSTLFLFQLFQWCLLRLGLLILKINVDWIRITYWSSAPLILYRRIILHILGTIRRQILVASRFIIAHRHQIIEDLLIILQSFLILRVLVLLKHTAFKQRWNQFMLITVGAWTDITKTQCEIFLYFRIGDFGLSSFNPSYISIGIVSLQHRCKMWIHDILLHVLQILHLSSSTIIGKLWISTLTIVFSNAV